MTNLTFVLPDQSFLFRTLQRCHYIDRYQEVLTDRNQSITLAEAVQAFFTATPAWVMPLVVLRNGISRLLGLKPVKAGCYRWNKESNDRDDQRRSLPLQVYSQSENEIVLGEDDRHLSFRIAFYLEARDHHPCQKILNVTTMVQFNNTLGRLYFLPVRPLHKILVPALLKNLAGERESRVSRASFP